MVDSNRAGQAFASAVGQDRERPPGRVDGAGILVGPGTFMIQLASAVCYGLPRHSKI